MALRFVLPKWIYFIFCFALLSGAGFGSFVPVSYAGSAEQQQEDQPTVYLTFDDGPSKNTSTVLDILAKENVLATFFVLGEQAEARPELITRIVNEGHSIGNHTYNHNYKQLYSDFREFWRQIKKTEDILDSIAGIRPSMIRAPGGTYTNFDEGYFSYLEQGGYLVYDWNVDSGDSKRRNVPASEIKKGAKAENIKGDVIVLMHDGGGHEETVKALPDIIRYYKDKGYQFAPLTPDVKPIQFGVASKIKWNRTQPSEAWLKEHVSANAAVLTSTQKQPELPLHIINGKDTVSLQNNEYKQFERSYYVQLRAAVERFGGTVRWSPESKKAEIRLGGSSIVLESASGKVTVSEPRKEPRSFQSSMWLTDGTTYISVRNLAEMMNRQVADYTLTETKREVVLK
ncbi:polysaccharide deacetylase [Paenibacillus sp. MSJ-34]|uniref:polysaccharide deacetylase n=1 Tax=Paenibacillus sp. MSJ-34 TaxID=2841529 RepID=UPI001C11FAEE|nr:polysaccharide deacetylase [Paenibacillus sp. MSJ-34]MBU5443272.1 polysaccharide deacetylase [Paenibacillus sp. MSJ-34]